MEERIFKILFYSTLITMILFFFLKDIPFFKKEEIIILSNPEDYTALVNQTRRLPSDYIPQNLEEINIMYANEHKYLVHDAKVAFEQLSEEAKKEGFSIIAVSAYRDYEYQKELYTYYVEKKGIKYAKKCSALPGHSEHQTGLAVDVMGSNLDYDEFENSVEFPWMKSHAHLYGFILRYPKGKEDITGFKYEPWHYRYVGIDVATYIYENKLTLEEYTEIKENNIK